MKYRKPYRIKKRKSIFSNRLFWLTLFIPIIFSGIFYLIFFHSFFQIKVVEISGNEKVSTDNLENLLNEKINRKILFFPSKSIFLVNLDKTKKEILKNFPPVEETDLRRKFPHTLLLRIEERKPAAVFCFTPAPNLAWEQEEKCFFIDREGIVFESLETGAIRQNFIRLKKQTDREVNLGEKVITEEQFSKILAVESKLKNELKISVEEILAVSEERFDAKTLEGWQIYFNFQEDLGWQLTKLGAVLEKEIPPERRKDLEYIDVRFGNFAPFIYRD